MTKPTGKPRGRPKTKAYVTLMARVPQDLADQAKHYAGQHRQTISDVLRDGLQLLMEEDRYRPFMPDINTASENTLDIHADSSSIMSYKKEDSSSFASETKEGGVYMTSDTKEEISSLRPDSPAVQSFIASDINKEASLAPVQPMQPSEPEPDEKDSVEWRRWAVLEQIRTADGPRTPGEIAQQIGATRTLVRSDLEYWRKQGRVSRQEQGGYLLR